MITPPQSLRNSKPTVRIAMFCFVLGLLVGCLSDPAQVDPPDFDEDVGPDDAGDGDVCEPITCDEITLEEDCGAFPDDCGGMLICGCEEHEICNVESEECFCTAESKSQLCEANEGKCGSFTVVDSCGDEREIDCDPCASYEDCWEGNGGTTGSEDPIVEDNTCYCEPETCEGLNAECGQFDDGCDGTVDCDSGGSAGVTCEGEMTKACQQTSDGGGWKWTCVREEEECTPKPDCNGVDCGTVDDGCGGRHECPGECGGDQICEANSCVCDVDAICDGVECGTRGAGDCVVECGECRQGCNCENGECSPEVSFGGFVCAITGG